MIYFDDLQFPSTSLLLFWCSSVASNDRVDLVLWTAVCPKMLPKFVRSACTKRILQDLEEAVIRKDVSKQWRVLERLWKIAHAVAWSMHGKPAKKSTRKS